MVLQQIKTDKVLWDSRWPTRFWFFLFRFWSMDQMLAAWQEARRALPDVTVGLLDIENDKLECDDII